MEEQQAVTVLWTAEDHLDTHEWSGDLGEVERVEDAYAQMAAESAESRPAYDEQEVMNGHQRQSHTDSSSRGKWTVWTRLLTRFTGKQTEASRSGTKEETTGVEIKPVAQQLRREQDSKATSHELERALEELRSMMSTVGFGVAFEDRYV